MDEGKVGAPDDWRESLSAQARGLVDRARAFDPETLSTGEVVGVAVGAAAALGTLLVALGPGEATAAARRPRAKPQEQERVVMADEPMVAVIKNGKLTRRTRKQLHKQADALQKEIDRLGKSIEKEANRVRRSAPPLVENGDASHTGEDLGKRLAAVGAATAAATAPLIDRARHFEIPDQVREGARQLAGTTRGRTSDLAERVRDEFVPLVVDRAGKVQDRVREEVVPQVAGQISRVREEIVPQVASRVREDIVPQVAERLQQVRDEIVPQVAEAASRVGARAGSLAVSGAAAGRDTAKTLASGDLGKKVGKQARQGRKQAAAALASVAQQIEPPQEKRGGGLWFFAILAAVGGLLYYFVFQDEERRKQVLETAKSVAEQGREIIRDFQGYDEEF